MTREFEDFMQRNTTLIVFLRWDTIAYMTYLESHYDEEMYECAYKLLEAIDSLFDFCRASFSMETETGFPEDMFEKSRINPGFLSHIGKACARQSDFYGQRWRASREVIDEEGNPSSGNLLFGNIYGCMHRISDDCNRILNSNEYQVEEKA